MPVCTESLVCRWMTRCVIASLLFPACSPAGPTQRYGFITRLGLDTLSVESVSRRGNTETSDGVDRFPRVRERHTEIVLGPDGGIRHLVMQIYTPSEPANQQHRLVVADVTRDSVRVSKKDGTGTITRTFATDGGTAMAHVPQVYSLYELYFDAALERARSLKRGFGDTVQLRQFYIDREFDRFPLHHGVVRPLAGGKAEIAHDWLAGIGEATLDSADHMLRYSGARTTYKVDVSRLTEPPDVPAVAKGFEAVEARSGVTQLSVRDTVRDTIGHATFLIDYGRPLVRGRVLLGNILPYDRVWRTGANAATQFTTSAPVTVGGIKIPAGTYTLWTVPRTTGADLIVNGQSGQWGTEYDNSHDVGMARMTTETLTTPVEKFTISIVPSGKARGALTMEWGTFRWTAPIEVR
jgi:hypothetical protein